MADNGFVSVIDKNAVSEVNALIDKLTDVEGAVKRINAMKITVPSQAKTASGDSAATVQKANAAMTEQEKLSLKLSNLRKSEAIENAKLKVQISDLTAAQKKQAKEVLGVMNAYQKLDAELGETRMNAKALAADMFLLEQAGETNSQQYKDLAATYSTVAARVSLLDTGLKKIDGNLGLNQRHVGDYARGWNGLGNAINQLTREAPAFAVSLNTGFLAISNNLPILSDEIANLVARNKELAASGQPTVSVLKQLATAFFSWQTALSVGVTILTLYGKEIVTWANNLFKGVKALNALADSQAILTTAREASKKSIIDEKTTIGLYLQTARDSQKSDEERAIAVKKLQNEYAFYFGKLTEGEILLGKTKDAELAVNSALEARSNSIAISEKYNNSQKSLIDINTAIAKQTKLVNTEQERQRNIRKAATAGTISAAAATDQLLDSYNRENANTAAITENIKRKNYQESVSNNLIKEAIRYKKESIGLEYQPESGQQSLDYQKLVDFQASAYELNRTRLENEAAFQKDIFENEENGYADREAAAEKYSKIITNLADIKRVETLRILALQLKQEESEINKSVSDQIVRIRNSAEKGELSQKEANASIYALTRNKNQAIGALEEQYNYDSLKAYEDYSQEMIGVAHETETALKEVWEQLSAQQRQNKIDSKQIDNLREISLLLKNVGVDTDMKGFDAIQNRMREINNAQEDAQVEELRMQKLSIQGAIDKLSAQGKTLENNEAIEKLQGKQIDLEKQALSIENKRLQSVANLRQEMKSATDQFFNSITSGFLNDLGLGSLTKFTDQVTYDFINAAGEIETKTGSTFDKMLDQAQTAGEKLKIVSLEAMSAFQEVFNFLQQNNQARFDAELTNIEREYEIRKKFAGGNADAEEELERQLADKKREIRVREAKAAKETALFNAIINTASAVVAALPNLGLSILAGTLGAIQIGLIASKPLPAYAEGTDNHPGGRAIVGDGGKHEVIRYPDGRMALTPNKDTLIDLPKGSQVYPDIASSGILGSGLPAVAMNRIEGVSASDMERIMNKTLAKMPVNNLVADAEGLRAYSERQGQRTEYKNRTVRFEGRKIR